MGVCNCACRDEVDPAPAQKLPAVKGVDTPRSVASCSTCDCIEGMPAQKRVSFSAAPAEVLHVVPYSEMYILHPDKFEFDSHGLYITDDESVDADMRSTVRHGKKSQGLRRGYQLYACC